MKNFVIRLEVGRKLHIIFSEAGRSFPQRITKKYILLAVSCRFVL